MRLIPGICTQCGATLSVDKEKDAMVCPYCNTPFIVEKAIQNFNNTYNITAQNVYIQDCKQDFEIIGGVLKKYNGTALDIVIPDSVLKIGKEVFKGTMIKSVHMPESVTVVEEYAFSECRNLTDIHLSSKLNTIADGAFKGCISLKKVNLPCNIQQLGNCVFDGCISLKTVELPKSLKSIGLLLFAHTELDSISISRSTIAEMDNLSVLSFANDNFMDDNHYEPNLLKVNKIYIDGHLLDENSEFLRKFSYTKPGARFINQKKWRSYGKCQHCGGELSGIFVKKCTRCGKEKDY